jgi:hypothetical protein
MHFPKHVELPTSTDFAMVVISAAYNGGGGKGPWEALKALDQGWWEGRERPDRKQVLELVTKLEAVRRGVLSKLDAKVLGFCNRPGELSWADLEHSLCKVKRARSMPQCESAVK